MTNSSPDRGRLAPAIDLDLRRAAAITDQRRDPAEIRRIARAEGYAAGWAEGRRAATAADAASRAAAGRQAEALEQRFLAAAELALTALSKAADRLERNAAPGAAEVSEVLVDGAFALAEALLARELRLSADTGKEALVRAVDLAPHGRPLTVRLNPDDLRALGLPHTVERDGRRLTLLADPELSRGDAIAECDAVLIDARLAAGLERAREVLGR